VLDTDIIDNESNEEDADAKDGTTNNAFTSVESSNVLTTDGTPPDAEVLSTVVSSVNVPTMATMTDDKDAVVFENSSSEGDSVSPNNNFFNGVSEGECDDLEDFGHLGENKRVERRYDHSHSIARGHSIATQPCHLATTPATIPAAIAATLAATLSATLAATLAVTLATTKHHPPPTKHRNHNNNRRCSQQLTTSAAAHAGLS
jgi:hypothetical protein